MKYVYRWEGVLIVLLLIEFILFSLINSDFLNISNLLFSTNDFLFIAIAAIPMTFVIVTGGIDVSVGSIMGLTSILSDCTLDERNIYFVCCHNISNN